MIYTIKESGRLSYENKQKKMETVQGYAFIDQHGRCFCIVYGKSRKNAMEKFLTD